MNDLPRLPAPDEPKLLSAPQSVGSDRKAANGSMPRRRVFIGVGLVLLLAIAWGAWSHFATGRRAAEEQARVRDFRPTVRVAVAKREDDTVKFGLPGTTLAFDQASIYARATGYIAERQVDIGSRVHAGDLLARIAAPDLDAQLRQAVAQLAQTQAALVQARANVDQAQANSKLAGVTNYRTSTLAAQGWETKQNADNTRASVNTNSANVESAQAGVRVAEANFQAQYATVQRLQELTGFERVVAPFDGVVTARTVDQGDLVSADASGGTAMFTVQRDDVIRAQSYVPQSGAVGLSEGNHAVIAVAEMPGRTFDGTVTRSADALDPSTRTLLVQVDIHNPEHLLHPGLYVDITFLIPRTHPAVVIPAEAVLFNADGLRVGVVGDDGRLRFRPIRVERDFGTSVELADGLEGGEKVALTPPVDIEDNQPVTIAAEKKDDQSQQPSASKGQKPG